MPTTCNPGQVRKSWKRLQARENRAVKGSKQVNQAKRGKMSLRCQARGKSLWCNTQDKPQVLKAGNNSTEKSAGKQSCKVRQTSQPWKARENKHTAQRPSKTTTKKNNQTNKEGGAKKRKRRHYCKANHAYECIKRFQNCFLARSRLFFRRGLAALFLTYWMPCSEYRDVQMSLSE